MRPAERSDLPRIVAIYNAAVPSRLATADTDQVSIESRRPWFDAHIPDKRPILVHEENGLVAGWVSFETFYGRPAYNKTAEISIYIDPQHCSKGLGSRLLSESLALAPQLGISVLVAYIFSHNEPSINLFKKFDFEEWGKLPDIAVMDGREYSLSIYGKHLTTHDKRNH